MEKNQRNYFLRLKCVQEERYIIQKYAFSSMMKERQKKKRLVSEECVSADFKSVLTDVSVKIFLGLKDYEIGETEL